MQELKQYQELISQIKQIRYNKNLRQTYIAKKCHMTQSNYSSLENCKRIITVDTLFRILNVLNIKLNLEENNDVNI